jgi:hypothetical protein
MPPGITFNVYGHDVSGSKTLDGVQKHAQKTATGIGGSFKKVGGLIAGAFAAAKVKDFLSDSMAEAREAQKVGAQTTAVIKSTGGAAHETAGQIGNLATSISNKVGIDDEAIQSGENMLLTFTNIRNEAGKGNDVFDQTTKIMTDMSVATGQSMTGSAVMLGKALNDPIAGLSKLTKIGVTFTQQQKDQVASLQKSGDSMGAQKVILAELNREFGGSAAAQATSADKMKVAFGNLEEQVGTALIPVVDDLENIMTKDVIPAFSATAGWLQQNWHWLKYVAGAVGAMWVAWKGYSITKTVVGNVSNALSTISKDIGALKAKTTAGAASAKSFFGQYGAGLGVLGATVGTVLAVGYGISKLVDGSDNVISEMHGMKGAIGGFRDALVQTNGVIDDNVRLSVAKALQDKGLASKASAAGISLKDLTTAVTGNSEAMATLIKRWQDSGHPSDETISKMRLMHLEFDAGRNSAKELGTAVRDTTGKEKDFKGAAEGTTGAIHKQVSAADALSASIKKLSGDKINAAKAELQFKDGIAGATQQVKDNGSSLAANTAKGRSNREWLLDQISSLQDVAQAQLDAGRSTQTVTTRMHDNENALRRAATAAGLNRDQVDALIKKYGKVPRSVTTKVNADDSNFRTVWKEVVNDLGSAPSATVYINGHPKFRTNAQGSGYFAGGETRINEYGQEFVNLPSGSRITTASQSASIARMGAAGGAPTFILQFQGQPLLTQADIGRAVGKALEYATNQGVKFRIAGSVVS